MLCNDKKGRYLRHSSLHLDRAVGGCKYPQDPSLKSSHNRLAINRDTEWEAGVVMLVEERVGGCGGVDVEHKKRNKIFSSHELYPFSYIKLWQRDRTLSLSPIL